MPLRPGEICEKCHKHIHPQTATSPELSHPLPPCASCLPPGVILLTCGGCKLTRYCGKACQKAHRPVHKACCEDNIRTRQCARNYGPETEAAYTSFAQWCEDNALAFSSAAFAALEISLDRQNAYEYILFVIVQTESRKDASNRLRFTHSVLLANKESRQFMHEMSDVSMGGPETVDRCLLSPSKSVTRVILRNIHLPPLVSSYTLTFINNYPENAIYPKPDPKWFDRLVNSLK